MQTYRMQIYFTDLHQIWSCSQVQIHLTLLSSGLNNSQFISIELVNGAERLTADFYDHLYFFTTLLYLIVDVSKILDPKWMSLQNAFYKMLRVNTLD